MSSFKREDRYAVIKYSQLTDAQIGFLKNCIHGEGIPTVECVVIEADWPEYEPVWKMLEDRVTGAPVEGGKAEYDSMAKAMTNDIKISRELAERCEQLLQPSVNPPAICNGSWDEWEDKSLMAAEELRALLAAPVVESQPLSVWEGAMPESNGKSNFTVILHTGDITEGICVYRSEYPDRARYEADCFRYLIGDPAFQEKPFVRDYDTDKHSGYAKPDTSPPEPVALVLPRPWRELFEEDQDSNTDGVASFSPDSYMQDEIDELRACLARVKELNQ